MLPITDKQNEYAEEIRNSLICEGVRVEVDSRNEKIGHKIREAQLEKVPYMFIIGGREAESRTIAVRMRKEGDIGAMPFENAINKVTQEINQKL